eukprot:8935495-Heterocapsa_arctica.AAC.1
MGVPARSPMDLDPRSKSWAAAGFRGVCLVGLSCSARARGGGGRPQTGSGSVLVFFCCSPATSSLCSEEGLTRGPALEGCGAIWRQDLTLPLRSHG